MYSWLIYAVAFSQIVVLYWLAAPASFRLVYHAMLNKNREWVDANPAFRQRYATPKYSIWICYVTGFGWLGALIYVFFFSGSDSGMTASLSVPILPLMLIQFGYMGIEYYRVYKKIPLPVKRSTSLERRALKDFLNPSWVYICYVFFCLVAGMYISGLVRGVIEKNLFIARMVGMSIAVAIGTFSMLYALRRKKQPVDDALGPLARKFEVFGTVAVLYICVFVGLFRTLQDFFSVYLFTDLAFFFSMSVLIQAVSLFCLMHASTRKLLAEIP